MVPLDPVVVSVGISVILSVVVGIGSLHRMASMSARVQRAAPVRINRRTVVSAGLEVFSRQGFHGTSMRDIASAAGTSLSNIYNYVPSKTDLLAEVLHETASDLLARLEHSVAAAGQSPASRLEALVRSYVDFIVDGPAASFVGISEIRYLAGEQRSAVVAVRDQVERLFTDTVTAGCAAGEFGTGYPRDAARAVIGLCTALSGWYQPGGDLDRVDLADRYAGFALGLVGMDRAAEARGSGADVGR